MIKILYFSALAAIFLMSCAPFSREGAETYQILSREALLNKIKGAWAVQTIGVTYGDPTEFVYQQRTIPDSIEIEWKDSLMYERMT